MVDFDRASFAWPASTVPEDLGEAQRDTGGVDFRLADLVLRVKQGSRAGPYVVLYLSLEVPQRPSPEHIQVSLRNFNFSGL